MGYSSKEADQKTKLKNSLLEALTTESKSDKMADKEVERIFYPDASITKNLVFDRVLLNPLTPKFIDITSIDSTASDPRHHEISLVFSLASLDKENTLPITSYTKDH